MNRPDIAAFALSINAAWMLTGAGLITLSLRRRWTSQEAVDFRNWLLLTGCAFGVGAIIVKVAL